MIHPTNTERFKQRFRFACTPTLEVRAFLQKPPVGIRDDVAQPRALEIAKATFDIRGKQIISVGDVKTRYLIGSYIDNFNSYIHLAFAATDELELSRDSYRINPVTKLEEQIPSALPEKIWVCVYFQFNNVQEDINPVREATIISTVPLKDKDTLGSFFIKHVFLENHLYHATGEYRAVKQ